MLSGYKISFSYKNLTILSLYLNLSRSWLFIPNLIQDVLGMDSPLLYLVLLIENQKLEIDCILCIYYSQLSS
jgi:hypothetical protein